MTTHYRSSSGEHREIKAMASEHLESAAAKLEREQPHRTEEIAAMRDELKSRASPSTPLFRVTVRRGRF